jgi:hypothetical protein
MSCYYCYVSLHVYSCLLSVYTYKSIHICHLIHCIIFYSRFSSTHINLNLNSRIISQPRHVIAVLKEKCGKSNYVLRSAHEDASKPEKVTGGHDDDYSGSFNCSNCLLVNLNA